ncbi:dienelactone hydrolase family protein [Paracoccus sp. (in: a-proteobacteria)]|uniref:dienelactone hydrolase family protein n=1 Tax=Paracoccus sp. TaxID=267 RepID=UPI0032204D62
MRKRLIGAAAVLVALLLALALNTARNYAGWRPVSDTPAQREAELALHWRLLIPEGPGPHPAAVLLSGCDGVQDNMFWWAEQYVDMGRAVLILDSHAPRNLDRAQTWRAVCAAQVLPGVERAGDLAVALAALRAMPGIDASDVALLGTSHGGWTVMEFLRLLGQGTAPPGLSGWPAPPADLAAGLGPVVLLYPYCGLLNNATRAPWPPVRALMLLAEQDMITNPAECRTMGEELIAAGTDLTIRTYAGLNHGFDQRQRSPLSPLVFDPKARARATRDVQDFMQAAAPGG